MLSLAWRTTVLRLFLLAACGAAIGCHKGDFVPASQNPDDEMMQPGRNAYYRLGEVLRFGQQGNSEPFRVSGWSSSEPDYTWTDGHAAVLQFGGIPRNVPLLLRMRLGAATSAAVPSQRVLVFANSLPVAAWQVTQTAEFAAVIAAKERRTTSVLTVELRLPDAFSPREVSGTGDPRLLAARCYELSITEQKRRR